MVPTFIAAEPRWMCAGNSSACNFTGSFKPSDDRRCSMPRDAWKFADDFTSVVTRVNLQNQWFRLNILKCAAIFNFMSSIGWVTSDVKLATGRKFRSESLYPYYFYTPVSDSSPVISQSPINIHKRSAVSREGARAIMGRRKERGDLCFPPPITPRASFSHASILRVRSILRGLGTRH